MKKQNIINLVKYYVEKNDTAFRSEVCEIARDFEKNGENDISEYIMNLLASTNFYIPQNNYNNLNYLKKNNYRNKSLLLPNCIQDDLLGIVRSINTNIQMTKIILSGSPGTGKTESAFQIARLLERDILTVRMEDLVDSHLGQTSKNIVNLFNEIKHLASQKVVILFDELDSIVMNRNSDNDLREMGRVTSTFLKEIDALPSDIIIIATTNMIEAFDKALIRRFDVIVSFDRYSKDDLIDVSCSILKYYIKKAEFGKNDIKLFVKILNNLNSIPYPGEMKQIIKVSLAFSDQSNEYDYLRRLYNELNKCENPTIQELIEKGFTTREIEVITTISKSSVSRKLKKD